MNADKAPEAPTPHTLRVPQDRETSTTKVVRDRFVYRYAYARSDDTQQAAQSGQDYLVVREDGGRLAFALCDGVSQSFSGDLAARLVGDAVLHWLWDQPARVDPLQVQRDLREHLNAVVASATERVRAVPLPEGLPSIVRDVLEEKRGIGSEANFAAGFLDMEADRLTLAWLGDLRVRLWEGQEERTADLGQTFLTAERWSSRRGVIGDIHVAIRPLKDLERVVCYSDGLAMLDHAPVLSLDNASLDAVIARARASLASDDISFLEISFAPGA